jgi:hypothetical protein
MSEPTAERPADSARHEAPADFTTQEAPAHSIAPEPAATTPPAPPSLLGRLSVWVASAAILIAVIAICLAAWALLRQPSDNNHPPPATAQQVTDAKAHTCAAFSTVRTAVSLQTNADVGSDPVGIQSIAANARLSMAGGGPYLVARLEPATPAPLATAIRSLADDLDDIAMNALAGVGNDDVIQADRMRDGEALAAQIRDLCK